ncbi:MAG TPA: SpoIIE family protein phosphatase [Candidatus Wunengus sp. YC60]|uniref:SpoIIE family protein phosphatase n=1 Tax=Candidatus Wunengus sp. YC60 TaxID=3367697 RepID=UPI004028F553
MLKNSGIALKLIVLILASTMLIFGLIFGYNYTFSRRIIEKNVEENAKNLTFTTVNKVETVLHSIEKIPENMAYFLENSTYRKNELLNLIRTVVKNNSEIYGSTISFEPYAFDKNALYFGPYFYKSNGKIRFTYLGGESYRYFSLDWYQIPKELNHAVWSEPYYDEGGGNIIMCTYSVPFYKTISGKKQFMGIVTADVSLNWLEEIVSSIRISQTGYGFLISRKGMMVTHPTSSLIMNETLFSIAETRNDARLREIGREMINGKSGFVPVDDIVSGKKCWLYYAPLPSSGWSLGVLFPQDELMADIVHLNHTVFLLGIIGSALLLGVIVFISRSITRPLRILARATTDIAKGNLDIEIPVIKSRDEVGRLGESFISMKRSLKQYIKELTDATSAKERIESELKIAHDIQMSILPKIFPPFPNRPEFDIFAIIEPSKEVGGDFYDFFLMDDYLYYVIGDVSGKGVPASLFMAVTKTLIKAKTDKDMLPDEILTKVNKELCVGNDSSMFVTIFCGMLNTQTGEVFYSNGGHNLPYFLYSHGSAELLENTGGMALGIMEDIKYQTKKFMLRTGDGIFLYTDGVTEAMDSSENLFSDRRLKEFLQEVPGFSPKKLIQDTVGIVKKFSSGAPQADDITIMALKYLKK